VAHKVPHAKHAEKVIQCSVEGIAQWVPGPYCLFTVRT